mmetsp:Transcript_21244/g.20401  ORF Transcript_21244/g.20401 Transcript_21244/m.20401 type:complete len:279 (-) Transcript_21244:648-1484(-)
MVSLVRVVQLFICTIGCQIVSIHGFSVQSSSILSRQFASVSSTSGGFSLNGSLRDEEKKAAPFLLKGLPSTSALFANVVEQEPKQDELVMMSSLSLRRFSWLSWWGQVILTTISTITLLFARGVMSSGSGRGNPPGFFLAGTGISLSFLSILWTWGGTRLARRLVRRNLSRISAATMIRRAIKVGVTLNLMGMFVTLLGAEQIVGSLAAKVLTMQGVSPFGNVATMAVATQTLQPLDILVVQANTNTLLSHFVSLASSLYLTRNVQKLDPPSEDDARK